MHFGLPILARKAGAVPETLGDAGVLFTELGYEEVAEMAHLLVDDEALRARIIARQRGRLDDFAPTRVQARLRAILGRLGLI
jgi:glycosyltransferase involved in cell wall biosynthesis